MSPAPRRFDVQSRDRAAMLSLHGSGRMPRERELKFDLGDEATTLRLEALLAPATPPFKTVFRAARFL